MSTHPLSQQHTLHHTPTRLAAVCVLAAWAAGLLAGCGGDVSWCYHNKSGQVVAGYNTTQCLPNGAGRPDTAAAPAQTASQPRPAAP